MNKSYKSYKIKIGIGIKVGINKIVKISIKNE